MISIAHRIAEELHVRLPQVSDVGGVIDYYQWLAILRVVGARKLNPKGNAWN